MKSAESETIGNFQVTPQGIVTRRDVLIMGAIGAAELALPTKMAAATPAINVSKAEELYNVRDFNWLLEKNLPGLSANQIEQHLKLYKGYVNKANDIYAKLKDVDLLNPNPTYSALRELLVEQSFAQNGVIYHELYFGNLGGKGGEPEGSIRSAIEETWKSAGRFMDYLKAAGKSMRGWVIVGWNTHVGKLQLYGLDMHNMWVPANVIAVLVLDVYEHAYMIDYGIDRGKYLDVFVNNIDWTNINKRLSLALKHQPKDEATP